MQLYFMLGIQYLTAHCYDSQPSTEPHTLCCIKYSKSNMTACIFSSMILIHMSSYSCTNAVMSCTRLRYCDLLLRYCDLLQYRFISCSPIAMSLAIDLSFITTSNAMMIIHLAIQSKLLILSFIIYYCICLT